LVQYWVNTVSMGPALGPAEGAPLGPEQVRRWGGTRRRAGGSTGRRARGCTWRLGPALGPALGPLGPALGTALGAVLGDTQCTQATHSVQRWERYWVRYSDRAREHHERRAGTAAWGGAARAHTGRCTGTVLRRKAEPQALWVQLGETLGTALGEHSLRDELGASSVLRPPAGEDSGRTGRAAWQPTRRRRRSHSAIPGRRAGRNTRGSRARAGKELGRQH
jgi:hypothetical protein